MSVTLSELVRYIQKMEDKLDYCPANVQVFTQMVQRNNSEEGRMLLRQLTAALKRGSDSDSKIKYLESALANAYLVIERMKEESSHMTDQLSASRDQLSRYEFLFDQPEFVEAQSKMSSRYGKRK